jgi:hypothetical protein
MAGIKRDRLDAVFSDLVRGRAGWKSDYLGGDGHLECAHIYGRARRSVRWHPMNAVCLTHYEHRYFTANPILFAMWCNAKFGPDYMHKLAMLAAQQRKFTPREIEGLYQHYKNELAIMTALRETGHDGRIEFMWPDPIIEAAPRKKAKKAKSKFKRKVSGQVVLRKSAA